MSTILPPGFDCAQIHALGLDRQDNLRAGAIRIACGEAQEVTFRFRRLFPVVLRTVGAPVWRRGRQDEEINVLNRSVFQRAVEIGRADEDRREWAMTMMLVARALERIGDNAVDVGEQVAFVVSGLFRESPMRPAPDPATWGFP